jgi:hypothetical protein
MKTVRNVIVRRMEVIPLVLVSFPFLTVSDTVAFCQLAFQFHQKLVLSRKLNFPVEVI